MNIENSTVTNSANSTFTDFSSLAKHRLEERLVIALNKQKQASGVDASTLHNSMAYSLLDGGKRLRAMLLISAYESICDREANDAVYDFAAAIECIHAYSLIHDDLPAMDDDELRRGKPTNHIVYGEANAILAGDALHTLAFDIIANTD